MKMIKKILFFKISFILVIIFCEIIIRMTYSFPLGMTRFDERFGRVRNTNSRFILFNEGFGIFDFNEFGYLETVSNKKYSDNTFKVAFLGDSFVESFQVFKRHHFLNYTEQNLIKDSLDIKTMNFGRSGFDFLDMYGYQKEFVNMFNPNLIVYMIGDYDLIPDSNIDPLVPRPRLVNKKVVTSLNLDEQEVNKFIFYQKLLNNSVLFNLINKCRKKIKVSSFKSIFFKSPIHSNDLVNKNEYFMKNNLDPIIFHILNDFDSTKTIIINIGENKFPDSFLLNCKRNGIKNYNLSPILKSIKDSSQEPTYWNVTNKSGHWNQHSHYIIGNFCSSIISEFINNGK